MRMTEQVFSKDEGGMPRTWGPRANIQAANQKARLAAAQLLAQLAVMRLNTAKVLPFLSPHVITSATVPYWPPLAQGVATSDQNLLVQSQRSTVSTC